MIYELINPSDAITFESNDLNVARTVCFILGNGNYGLEDESGKSGPEVCPLFLFGGFTEWASKNNYDLDMMIAAHGEEIAEAMDSALCCQIAERTKIVSEFGTLPKDELTAKMIEFNQAKHTSLNNICGRANLWSKKIRAKIKADIV